jgi:CRP-like cAMP-binding protein
VDLWHLTRLSWLASLKPALAEEVRRAAFVRTYAPGEEIFGPKREPENVWLVEHGLVRLHRLAPDGRQVTIALVRPGHVFGGISVLSDSPRISFAEAMRRSTCWRIPRETFLRVVRSDPEAGFAITKEVAGRMARIESRLEDLAFRNVESRLARTLLRLAEEFGQPAGDWIQLEVSLTQAELATLVGTTRQSISETLGGLVARGAVARDRGRLALKRDALAATAGAPLE